MSQDLKTLLLHFQEDYPLQSKSGSPASEDYWREAMEALSRIGTETARRCGLPAEDADDITQALLLKLQSKATLRKALAADSTEAYLRTMARNEAISLQRRRTVEEKANETQVDRLRVILSARPSEAKLDRRLILREALRGLPEGDQQLLRLRFWEGWSVRELAEWQKVKRGTMAVRLFRVLHRVRQELQTQDEVPTVGGASDGE